MKYTMNFGRLAAQTPKRMRVGDDLRIAVLGDFSGRANARKVEVGKSLAAHEPRLVDIDNFEATCRQWNAALRLPIGAEGAAVDVKFESLDDFHPDQLYGKLEIFGELGALRRRLVNTSTLAAAASDMKSWPGIANRVSAARAILKPRGTSMPSGKLSDFARLIGQTQEPSPRKSPVDELIKQVMAPYIVPAPHPDQDELIAAVDEALSATMRRILHHPDLQALEALWRSVDLLTRELETSNQLQIVLYDITAEEIAADLSSTDALESSGLYELIVEKPITNQRLGPPSVLIGNYIFEISPPHAELLGRISQIAAAAGAPFIAGISTDCLIQRDPNEIHPLITESWSTLRQMRQANYIGLTVPRFMLRWPYGVATEPIESFNFEEFTPQAGLGSMLWANGSILAGLLLGKTFVDQGLSGMKLGSQTTLGDVPFYYYTDPDGDQVALPSTERMVSEATAVHIISQHFMPVVSIRGRPEVRLGSFISLGGAQLAGPWAPLEIPPDERKSLTLGTDSTTPDQFEQASIDETESCAAVEAQRELDALLTDDSTESASSETELDAALVQVAKNAAELPPAAGGGMDPELAALLDKL